MFKKIKFFFSKINILVIILLLLIHFVLKESTYFCSLLYYTFPLPLIIITVVFLCVFLNKKTRTYNLVLAIVLSIIWLSRSFKINTLEPTKESDIEIVFWNATHKREFRHVFDNLENTPDVVVLVEYHAEELEAFKLKYPNFFFYWHDESEIGIFSKSAIKIKDICIDEDETVVINFTTNNLNFYAVDIAASFNMYRKDQVEFVSNVIKITNKTIILGDFNTPLESKFLKAIKTNFNHVLNKKGNGFRETWFWNIPLLSLDHIWVSKDLDIIDANKIGTFKSDHSMIKTTIRK